MEDRCLPSIGTFEPSAALWFLRQSNSAGAPDVAPFTYGGSGWTPLMGDWNGDGTATIGVFHPAAAGWYLRNTNSSGAPDITPFGYGGPNWIPVAGDWDGDGTTTIGVFDPGSGTWYLRNSNSAGAPDIAPFPYGAPGWIPVVGDWNGDGIDTVGVFNPANAVWYLRNSNRSGAPDIAPFGYGGPGWRPVVGDWNGDGTETIGVVQPASAEIAAWYLRNSNGAGAPDITPFAYGAGAWSHVSLSVVTSGLLRGAVNFPGPYPPVTTVTFTDSTGQQSQVQAFTGQVQVFFDPSTSQQAAAGAIQAGGGRILGQIPNAGYYLVGVSAGQEGAFISAMNGQVQVRYAAPHVVGALTTGATVLDHCGLSHGIEVIDVLTHDEGGELDQCRDTSVPGSAVDVDTDKVIRGIIAEANENRGAPTLLNLSASGIGLSGWLAFMRATLQAIASLPEELRRNLVIAISAGNENFNIDPLLNLLRRDPRIATILTNNVLVVTSSPRLFLGAADTNGDADVAIMTNPRAADGTSFAAPAAMARLQQVMRVTGASAQVALQAAKQAVAANPNHELVTEEAIARARAILGQPPPAGEMVFVDSQVAGAQNGQLAILPCNYRHNVSATVTFRIRGDGSLQNPFQGTVTGAGQINSVRIAPSPDYCNPTLTNAQTATGAIQGQGMQVIAQGSGGGLSFNFNGFVSTTLQFVTGTLTVTVPELGIANLAMGVTAARQ